VIPRQWTVRIVGAVLGIAVVVGPRYLSWHQTRVDLDPDFVQTIETLKLVTAPRAIRASSFGLTSGADGTPSAWVEFFFSPLGAGVWPIVEGSVEDDPAYRVPKLPPTVAVVAQHPRPGLERQVVLSAEDENWELVARVFVRPDEPPIAEVRWTFPRP